MAASNFERIGKALDLFNQGLAPFVEKKLLIAHGKGWESRLGEAVKIENGKPQWDTSGLLGTVVEHWQTVFKQFMSQADRGLVSEVSEIRNQWAHQRAFSTADTHRALDSMVRLLTNLGAPQAKELEPEVHELLRIRFEEHARRETKKGAVLPTEGAPASGLRPWREIITPHQDVASGRYLQAEFAADLAQVHRGEGTDEYRKPKDFFQRTFITDGLKRLLSGALLRLGGTGGDPVVDLQTNFGGGKTHSMLALYHLFSGASLSDLPGIEPVIEAADGIKPMKATRAVLVGTALTPAQPHKTSDGLTIKTLWGEMAYQLGGKALYQLVAQADDNGISPGSNVLKEVLQKAAPCLVLVDEWVAYVRQVYRTDGMPGGSFDANLTFAQALTEAARATPKALVVASIPSSDIEIGGEGGREALVRIQNTFGRMGSSWRPASAEEGFEIVRRRLFQPITESHKFANRDAVVRSFAEMYRTNAGDFPSDCREGDYERRLKAAFPIHPELFDRLYNDWSTLDRFQRTRGVLRLMSAVIHALWERQDGSLLIMPGNIPVDDPAVQHELTRYMEDPWVPVIEKDVDGPHSLPLAIDRENPNLGRYSASRRVTRTIYLGSAPTANTANRGLEDRSIKLGCTQPGESAATFGDALRRLTDQATHLYVDGRRYWLSTQPSVTRLAHDRALQASPDDVQEEIRKRVRNDASSRGDFSRIHACPVSSGDIPDEYGVRLVILPPEHTHAGKVTTSPARIESAAILELRGTSPRLYKNNLLFLAADKARLIELSQAVRQHLAWSSIRAEMDTLNLDPHQQKQVRTKADQADDTVKARLPETFCWLLVPFQPDPNGPIEWEEVKLQGNEALGVRAAKKAKHEGKMITEWSGSNLRIELDKCLWRGDHVKVRQLAEDFAQYLYLPRLRDSDVLIAAIRDGLSSIAWDDQTFAAADGFDEKTKKYRVIKAGSSHQVINDSESVVLRPAVARAQLDAEAAARTGVTPTPSRGAHTVGSGTTPYVAGAIVGAGAANPSLPMKPSVKCRFHGTISLDPTRVARDAGNVANEVVQHLAGLVGSNVEITLEISAEIFSGVPENIVRIVTENCRTLKFRDQAFEED